MRPTALVTGAAVRVGAAVATELARSGFDVAVHYRSSAERALETVAACVALGADAWAVQGDLATADGCDRVASAVRARWTGLNLLVNNASLFAPMPFEDIDDAAWARMLDVNLTAPFRLCRDLLGSMRSADGRATGAPAGRQALVVHLCDIGADRPVRGYTHYSVSKAGLAMLVKSMAVELAPAVRTVGISPGQVVWPDDYDAEARARLARRIPMGEVGSPEDIARLVRFLALEGHYINGDILAVDGGLGCRYG